MQRNALRAVALAAMLVCSVLAGFPVASETAVATDDTEPFDQTETIQTNSDEYWQHGFESHDGELYVAGAQNDEIRVYDSSFAHQTTHALAHQPSGLTRFDGSWIVASADSGTLERYDDEFAHQETVVDGDFSDTSTAPWNVDTDGDRLYVADETEVVVFDSSFAEVDRFSTDADPIHPLVVESGSVFVMDNSDDPVHEYTTDGESVGTYDTGVAWDMGPGGMGYFDGAFYASDGGQNDELYELHAGLAPATETISGTVEDQHGVGVGGAAVTAWGVSEPALADSGLEREADALLADLSDPLPDTFDRDYDLESHLEYDETYALAHESDDWGVGTTHIADSSVEDPRVVLESDREVTLSLWDPTADGGWLENQVDQSFPGATVEGTIVVDQLGPGGDTLETREYDTEVIAESTGVNPLTTHEHHGVRTHLPTGIYHVHPEGDPAGGYVVAVGEPDEIAAGIAADLRDEAGQLTDRASEVADLRGDGVLVRETVQADSDGKFELEVPADTEAVTIDAVGADAEALADLEEPTLADLRDVRETYNGSVVVPAPGVETVAPPAEDVTVDVYRTPEVPYDDLERYAEVSQWLEDEFLNQSLAELQEPFDAPLETIDEETLREIESDLENLSEANDDLADAVGDSEDISDVRERIDELYDALEEADRFAPGERDGEIVDGELEVWQAFPEAISEAVVTVEYEDGTVETVPPEYVSVESEGWLGGDRVTVSGYDVGERAVADVSIQAAGDSGVGSGGVTLENDAVAADLPALEALHVSSLAPGPDERVAVDARGDVRVADVDVLGPDGDTLNASVDGERVEFDADGVGVHTVVLALESGGHDYQVVERVEAVETSRSDPANVRVGDSVVGPHAVVNGELEGGDVDVGPGSIDVTAVAGADDVPGSVHVQPAAVLEGSAYDIDVAVEYADGSEVRSHVETVVHFERGFFTEETITWRDGDPVTQDGSTRFGDVQTRGDEKRVLYTYTDEFGAVTLAVDSEPGYLDRVQHWAAVRVPQPTVPFV